MAVALLLSRLQVDNVATAAAPLQIQSDVVDIMEEFLLVRSLNAQGLNQCGFNNRVGGNALECYNFRTAVFALYVKIFIFPHFIRFIYFLYVS